MPFASGPILTYVGLGRYQTVGSTVYVGKDQIITIPDGFETDLASVPRIFWALLPPSGVYERAAVLHDACCVWLAEGTSPVSARDADGLFRRVAREGGAGFLTRWLLWWGVRLGALANPARRKGWLRDAPLVTAITVAALAVTCLTVFGLDRLAHSLAHLI